MNKVLRKLSLEIESAVSMGEKSTATKLLKQWGNLAEPTSPNRLRLSEWYRRIADTSNAIKALNIHNKFYNWHKLSRTQAAEQLQLARLLNAWGASRTALELLREVPNYSIQENPLAAGGIYITNYQYPEAEAAYRIAMKSAEMHTPYLPILYARSLQGLKKFAESDEILFEMERNLRGKNSSVYPVIWQTLASNAVLKGEIKSAGTYLEKMEDHHETLGESFDRGNGWKWWLAYFAHKKDKARAMDCFKKGMKINYVPGEKPEIWTEFLFWRGLMDYRKDRSRDIPHFWKFLFAFPAYSVRARNWIEEEIGPVPEIIKIGHARSQEFDCNDWNWSLTETIEGYLTISGEWGVPAYRLSEFLWKGEPHAVFSWERRLDNLVHRLRSQNRSALTSKDRHLFLELNTDASKRSVTIYWKSSELISPKQLSFLSNNPIIKRKQIADTFRLPNRTATRAVSHFKDLQQKLLLSNKPKI